jgi:hypothetical protein
MMQQSVVCLSAGMLAPKKTNNPIARLHLYLNYGLLGLASILSRAGCQTCVVHGRFEEPEDCVSRLQSEGKLPCDCLLLSIPSSFAIEWARRAVLQLRANWPSLRIVVGGRWVVADDEHWIRSQLPDVDQFVPGLAEDRILNIVRTGMPDVVALARGTSVATSSPALDYDLLSDMALFHPSLEVSRGCGMHCSFCAEAEEPLSSLKSPGVLAAEFAGLIKTYGTADVHPYLEASFFRPSTRWAKELGDATIAHGARLSWRAETRVDSLSPRLVADLALAGFKVVDLGLESASPLQLRRMKKTTQPEVYLRRASELLRACYQNGVWPKVNVLLHPGETPDTLAQTEAWLDAHRPYIKGVSVGPTIVFRYGTASADLLREFEQLGAGAVDPMALDRDGFAHLHLSSRMSHEQAISESARISREFMSMRDYYDLKSFSYLPRTLAWDEFRAMVGASSDANYSFQT